MKRLKSVWTVTAQVELTSHTAVNRSYNLLSLCVADDDVYQPCYRANLLATLQRRCDYTFSYRSCR